jgi:hypothetical protein
MDAREFMSSFQNIFTEKREKAITTYYSNSVFTSFITEELNGILAQKEYKKQNEYFRIDAIRWSEKAKSIIKTPGVSLKKHLWDLEIAVEHENDPLDWMDEVVKLSHIACPLRVVIGYMPWDKREDDQKYLDHVAKWIETLTCKDNIQKGEFLIILGNCNTEGQVERYFNYKGYLLNPKSFRFEMLKS